MMEVTRILPDEEWQDAHRGREWLSLKQAAEKLNQDKLKPMLWQLEERMTKTGSRE